jgi:hypothetical protein
LKGAVVKQEIGRIDIGWEPCFVALENLALGSGGNTENAKHLAPVERSLSLHERPGACGNPDGLIGIQGLNDGPAQIR